MVKEREKNCRKRLVREGSFKPRLFVQTKSKTGFKATRMVQGCEKAGTRTEQKRLNGKSLACEWNRGCKLP